MKKLILLLLFSVNLFSQNLNYLTTQDTIFIVLKEIKGYSTIQYEKFTLETYGNSSINEYIIRDSINRVILIRTQNNSENNLIVKRKSFFKKNSSRIINMDFIRKFLPEKLFINTLDVLNQKKIFYIIDESKKRKSEIKIKKASVVAVLYTKM